MTLFEYLSFPFVQYALVVGVMVALCASLIGVPLVLKRFSLIGEGLAHLAFTGMAVAAIINIANDLFIIMPLTIFTAILLLVGRNKKIQGDASIAMISVGALALGYFIINVFSKKANVSADVCASLFGSTAILTLHQSDVVLGIIMSVLVILTFLLFYNKIFALTFDPEFSKAAGVNIKIYEIILAVVIGIVVALSMRLVGSLLTSALIIFPALSSMRIFKSFRSVVICSAIIAIICAFCGMIYSIIGGTPVGATIVIANMAVFFVFSILGLIIRRA